MGRIVSHAAYCQPFAGAGHAGLPAYCDSFVDARAHHALGRATLALGALARTRTARPVIGAGPFLLFSWAATKLPSGYVALLNSTAVVFGTLASAWMKEDTVTLRKLFGGVVGLCGVGLVVRLGPVEPTTDVMLGTGAAILASLCFGLSTPLMKRATRRMEPLAIAGPVHASAFLFLLPTGLFYWPQSQFTPLAMAITLVLGVVTSGLAFWAHLRIMRHMTPVAAMSPMFFIPMFGVAWGHLILGEALGSGIYLGGALVLLGAALVTGYNPLRRDPITRSLPHG